MSRIQSPVINIDVNVRRALHPDSACVHIGMSPAARCFFPREYRVESVPDLEPMQWTQGLLHKRGRYSDAQELSALLFKVLLNTIFGECVPTLHATQIFAPSGQQWCVICAFHADPELISQEIQHFRHHSNQGLVVVAHHNPSLAFRTLCVNFQTLNTLKTGSKVA